MTASAESQSSIRSRAVPGRAAFEDIAAGAVVVVPDGLESVEQLAEARSAEALAGEADRSQYRGAADVSHTADPRRCAAGVSRSLREVEMSLAVHACAALLAAQTSQGTGVEQVLVQQQIAALHQAFEARMGEIEAEVVALREAVADADAAPESLAGPFLASPPPSSDAVGVARVPVFAPLLMVDSPARYPTASGCRSTAAGPSTWSSGPPRTGTATSCSCATGSAGWSRPPSR